MNEADRITTHIIAVTSGKGGVGKTFFTANLAAALARAGQRVLVMDADLGLANLDIILNLQPKATLHDVLNGGVELDDVILSAPCGFSVLPAGSGLAEYSRLSGELRERLRVVFDRLEGRYDCLLIDTGAGIADLVQYAASLADELVVVSTPEPTALADAYASIKVLSADRHRGRVHLVINQVRRAGEGVTLTRQLQQVVDRFLTSAEAAPPRLGFLGEIPHDAMVGETVRSRTLLLEVAPGSPVGQAITGIAGRLSRQLLASAA
ncbi:MAG: MinD/ParA family protein [Burkholderiales bacterium]|nr:MinD/ParA family protein [Burkholderiales bacterium]